MGKVYTIYVERVPGARDLGSKNPLPVFVLNTVSLSLRSEVMITSLPINDPRVSHACVTASAQYGSGVFSWHSCLEHAEMNAELTGGVAVPVDWVDGVVIIPNRAKLILDRALRSA